MFSTHAANCEDSTREKVPYGEGVAADALQCPFDY